MNVSSPIFRPGDTENSETDSERKDRIRAAEATPRTSVSRWSHLADDDDGQAGKEGVEEPKPRLLRRSSVPARPRRLEEHLRKQNTREGTVQRERPTQPSSEPMLWFVQTSVQTKGTK